MRKNTQLRTSRLAWFFGASIWISAAGLGAQPEPPSPAPKPPRAFPGTNFRYTSTVFPMLDQHQTETWQITVEQSGGARGVRLHNSSPAVIELEGGADQVVPLVGAPPWTFQRKVTGLGLGPSHVSVQPEFADARQEAGVLARVLSASLQGVEDQFMKRRAQLPVLSRGTLVPSGPVLDLLNSTEVSLRDALNYPELTALRDHVEETFRQAREKLRKTRHAVSRADSLSTVVLASLSVLPAQGPPRGGGGEVSSTAVASVLDTIGQLLSRLRNLAQRNELVVDLCIRSSPVDRAEFFLHPKSYDRDPGRLVTDGKLLNIYRGLYVYKVEKRGHRGVDCGWTPGGRGRDCALDLVDDSQQLRLDCNLADGLCQRRPDPGGACVAHAP